MPCPRNEYGALATGRAGFGERRGSRAADHARTPEPSEPPPRSVARSLRGLDWFIFFVADVQTGFGPFVSVYLTAQKWTQVDIGLVLSASGLVALAGQMPGGALVDAARSERLVAGIAIAAISVSALAYAASPIFPVVLSAAVLHALASCVLGPAIAAISLGLVGHAAIGERFGRNARFASIGNGLAAAAMGACGYFLSARAVFFVTAILLVPALLALRSMSPQRDRCRARAWRAARGVADNRPPTETRRSAAQAPAADPRRLRHAVPSRQRRHAAADGQRADDAVEPMGDGADRGLHRRAATGGRRVFAVGRAASAKLGTPALAAHRLRRAAGARLAVCDRQRSNLLVAVQILDGITASVLGVMVPLIVADITRGTGHFNLGQGIVGTTTGIGASLSTTLAGYISDHFGSASRFPGIGGGRDGRPGRRLAADAGDPAGATCRRIDRAPPDAALSGLRRPPTAAGLRRPPAAGAGAASSIRLR